jgi:hypothetical protein
MALGPEPSIAPCGHLTISKAMGGYNGDLLNTHQQNDT